MLQRIEGFDFLPVGLSGSERERISTAKGYYCDSQGLVPTTGRFGFGNSIYPNGAFLNGSVIGDRIPIGAAISEGFIGVAVKVPSGGATGQNYVALFDGVNNTSQIIYSFLNNGVIAAYRASGSFYGNNSKVLIGLSDIAAYQEDQWFYFEMRGKTAASGGIAEARVNTKTVLSFPAVNTDNTGRGLFDMIALGAWANISNFGNAKDIQYDDLYVCDTTGSENNSYLGNCRVMTQLVAGNSTPQDFAIGGTAPAATAWQSLLNTNLDDTKYIHDGTVGDESLFTIQAIVNAPTVFGIQVSSGLRQDDATQRIAHNVIKSGATAAEGADQYTNQTYTYYRDIFETNPDTGVGFSGSELNSLLQGIKIAA